MDTVAYADIDLTLLLEIEKHSSYREMAEMIHKSLRTVQLHLTGLEWRGMIERPLGKKSRSLKLTPMGERTLNNAFPKRAPVR